MQVKDVQYFVDLFNRVSASVTRVNEKIVACNQKKVSAEELSAMVALEQLEAQHDALIILATLIMDPAVNANTLPVIPKRITGFSKE
jgi:hypothetical protein